MFKKSFKYLVVWSNGSVERYRTREQMWDQVVRYLIQGAEEIGIESPDFKAPEQLYLEICGALGETSKGVPQIYNRKLEEVTFNLL